LAPVASLVNVHHQRLNPELVGPLGGVSCLSAPWYYGVLEPLNPAWIWTTYSRSDNDRL